MSFIAFPLLAVVGATVVFLGLKGFTAEGIPLSDNRNIRGLAGFAVGILTIALGLGIIAKAILLMKSVIL